MTPPSSTPLSRSLAIQHQEHSDAWEAMEETKELALIGIRARLREAPTSGLIEGKDYRLLARVKEWPSVRPKIEDGRCARWDECSDLLGLKVVTVSSQEVQQIRSVVDGMASEPSVARLWHNSNGRSRGYSGIHSRISLQSVMDDPASPLDRLGAEVQVLTELQHAWDLVTHDEFYKATDGVPITVRQRLLRVAAAIDLLDEEMRVARRELTDLRATIEREVQSSAMASPYIDEVSILALARGRWRSLLERMQSTSVELGFRRSDWPEVARCGPEMDALLMACESLKFSHVQQLDEYVRIAASDKWNATLEWIASDYRAHLPADESDRLFNRPLTILLIILLFEHPFLSGPFLIPSISASVRRARVAIVNDPLHEEQP